MTTCLGMTGLVLVALLLTGAKAEGCERQCTKQVVPCTDGRQDGQVLCVEIVRRCEVVCGEGSRKEPAPPVRPAGKAS